jgi:hypothetical protein
MNINIKENIYFLLNSINEISQLIQPGGIIKLDIDDKQNVFLREIGDTQLDNMFSMLEKKHVIKVIKKAEPLHAYTAIKSGLLNSRDVFCYFFLKDKNFNSFFYKIKNEIYSTSKKFENEPVFRLSYDKISRQIAIEDLIDKKRYYLKTPNADNQNRVIFEFLFDNPNTKFNKTELNEIVKNDIGKSLVGNLDKIAFELGFNKSLKKVFFSTSKDSARLRNQITGNELSHADVDLVSVLNRMKLKKTDI